MHHQRQLIRLVTGNRYSRKFFPFSAEKFIQKTGCNAEGTVGIFFNDDGGTEVEQNPIFPHVHLNKPVLKKLFVLN